MRFSTLLLANCLNQFLQALRSETKFPDLALIEPQGSQLNLVLPHVHERVLSRHAFLVLEIQVNFSMWMDLGSHTQCVRPVVEFVGLVESTAFEGCNLVAFVSDKRSPEVENALKKSVQKRKTYNSKLDCGIILQRTWYGHKDSWVIKSAFIKMLVNFRARENVGFGG